MGAGTADDRPSRVHKQSKRYKTALKQLGLRVRQLRLARHWTLDKAAERMDLDLKHLQKIEAGTVNVTLVTLLRIAEG